MMKKYVVVSTSNNPDYYFYLPYIEKAWNTYGWNVCVMVTDEVDIKNLVINNPETMIVRLPQIAELREATIAQAGRLYAANYLPLDALIMTSDMDLLPLSDYWHPSIEDITVYGHDLTDYTFYPMGYCAMSGHNWKKYLNCTLDTETDILKDCQKTGQAFSIEWEQWWNTDWQILTDKLSLFKESIKFIKRGRRSDAGFAFGRIDRGDSMKIIPEPWIDAHCENNNVQHPERLDKFLKIFEKVYGKL